MSMTYLSPERTAPLITTCAFAAPDALKKPSSLIDLLLDWSFSSDRLSVRSYLEGRHRLTCPTTTYTSISCRPDILARSWKGSLNRIETSSMTAVQDVPNSLPLVTTAPSLALRPQSYPAPPRTAISLSSFPTHVTPLDSSSYNPNKEPRWKAKSGIETPLIIHCPWES